MKAADVMTLGAATVRDDASIGDAARTMLQYGISGLPVVDAEGALKGIVTERDFLRRAELGTERQRPRWAQVLLGAGTLADDYIRAHGREVSEVMTREVVTVAHDAPLSEVVEAMERHGVKRVPVMRDGRMIGIVSRANLLTRVARLGRGAQANAGAASDDDIRARILDELDEQPWRGAPTVDVVAENGVVSLRGSVTDARVRDAVRVLAENVDGVKRVEDRLKVIAPVELGWP